MNSLAEGFKGEPLTLLGINQVGTNDSKSTSPTCSHQCHCLEPNRRWWTERGFEIRFEVNTLVCRRMEEAVPIQDPTDTELQNLLVLQDHATPLCASRNTQRSLGIFSFGSKDISSRDTDDHDLGGT